MIGRIHSIESCGTVDGPGIRFVVFMQGCPLRCEYCHNPDSWNPKDGKEITVDEVISEATKYKSYMRYSNGGITISGGEPLMQPDFVKELLTRCKDENIHTVVDTSGYMKLDYVKDLINSTDLVLLDIKSYNDNVCTKLTGVSNKNTLELANYLSRINKPTWIRYVLVPGITDDMKDIEELAKFLSSMNNIEKVQILPFHKMGEYKWKELGFKYKLENVQPPSDEIIAETNKVFDKYGIKTE